MPTLKVMPNPFNGGLSRVVLVGDARRVWAIDYSQLFNDPSALDHVSLGHALALRAWKWGGAAILLLSLIASFLWAWWAFVAGFAIQFLLWKAGQRSAANFAVLCAARKPEFSTLLLERDLTWVVDPPEEVDEFLAAVEHRRPAARGGSTADVQGSFDASAAVRQVRDTEDLLFNPAREDELQAAMPSLLSSLKADFMEGRLTPQLEDMLVELIYEPAAGRNPRAAEVLAHYRAGRREPVLAGLRQSITEELDRSRRTSR